MARSQTEWWVGNILDGLDLSNAYVLGAAGRSHVATIVLACVDLFEIAMAIQGAQEAWRTDALRAAVSILTGTIVVAGSSEPTRAVNADRTVATR